MASLSAMPGSSGMSVILAISLDHNHTTVVECLDDLARQGFALNEHKVNFVDHISSVKLSTVSATVISSSFGIAFEPVLDPENRDGTAVKILTPPCAGAAHRVGVAGLEDRARGYSTACCCSPTGKYVLRYAPVFPTMARRQ